MVRDGTVGVGSLEVDEKGRAGGGEAQAALQAGVKRHGGVFLHGTGLSSHLRASKMRNCKE
jgi:hypothetical protein